MSLPSGLCLVTGATGFVGSAVARALLGAGHPVRVLARPNSDRRNLEGLAVEIARGSLEYPGSLAAAVAGCRYLFHVAADYRLWVPDPEAMFRVNVAGTRDLMLAAADADVVRIVYTSSVATLGIVPDGVADEETPSRAEDMIGPYKRSKFEAEAVVREMIAERGLPAVIVNPSTPIGPGDIKPTPTGRLIVEAARGRMPGYVDTGLNIAHVDDVAVGHLLAAKSGRDRPALYSRRRESEPRRNPRRGRAAHRAAPARVQDPARGAAADRVRRRSPGAADRARTVRHGRRGADVEEEDVFHLGARH